MNIFKRKNLFFIAISFLLLSLSFSCKDTKIKLDVSEMMSSKKQLLFFSLKNNTAIHPLRFAWQNIWKTTQKKYPEKIFFYKFQYNHSPFELNNTFLNGILVVITGENNEEINLIRQDLLKYQVLTLLNLQSSYNLSAIGKQQRFFEYPKISLVFEERKNSFMKISGSSKKKMIESEEENILSWFNEVSINSNWINNGGNFHIVRFLGYPKEKSWGNLTWDGYIFRNINKLKNIQSISANKIDIDNLLKQLL